MPASFRRTRHLIAIALGVMLALAAGCGGSGGTDASSDADPLGPATAPTEQGEPEPTASPPSPASESDSPIDALLGVPIMDDAAMNDHLIDMLTEGERRTAECMIAEGFEYTPVAVGGTAPSARTTVDERAFAEEHGFGIVASFDAAEFDAAAPADRNAAYLATLGPNEREAYETALYGEPLDESTEGDDFAFFNGCKALASEELMQLFGVLIEFDAPATDVFDRWQADPRMQESRDTWTACMADAGYPDASDAEEIRELVFARLEPILSDDSTYADPETELDPSSFDPRADWSFLLAGDHFSPHPALTPAGRAAVDEVADFERALAVAHLDCHEPLRDAELEVQREYEQILVDEIGDQVAARLAEE